jgi:Putative adhesin
MTQPAPPQHRTPVAIRRALLVVSALFAFVAVAWGAFSLLDLAARHTTTERATYDGVRALVIEDASDVRLVGAPAASSLQVVARVTEGLWSPDRSSERPAGGELRLSSSCPVLSGSSCSVDYTIRVPSGTVVRAGASGGDVVAENLSTTRPLELASSAGDVTAIDITAPSIVLSSSAGDVIARGLSTRGLRAESSAGDVAVALDTVAERLVAQSSAGDVDVLVPDAVYNVDATSSAGDENTRIRSDPESRRELTAHSSAGDVSVAARP